MSALDRLAALDKSAAWLATAGDDQVRAVGAAIRDWLDGGAAEPLDRMLAGRRRGGVSARHALALADRDALLRHLRRQFVQYGALAPSAAARTMALHFNRYSETRWPRECRNSEPPAAEPAATWWRILRAGMTFPKAKRLAQILADDGKFNPTFEFPAPFGTIAAAQNGDTGNDA